jgi:hypothetical protein
VDSPGPTSGDGTWATHLTRQLTLARACSRLYLVAPELLALLAIETRQRVRTGLFAGAIDLDVGVIATLDPVGHPARLPSDTVVWPCGAYGCCCGGCVPDQPCPAVCTVEPINGIPGAHHLILGEPDWTPDIDDLYRRLRADGWTPAGARRAASRR